VVKKKYWHDLDSLYDDLPEKARSLSPSERALLTQANAIYSDKRFEYMDPFDAGTAFSGFPDLNALQAVAVKLLPSKCHA